VIADGPIEHRRALSIAQEIASATAAAHELGIVHRDIKPGNVLVDPDGRVRVVDFGLASVVDLTRTERSEHVPGSVSFMAPEKDAAARPAAHELRAALAALLEGRPWEVDAPLAPRPREAAPPVATRADRDAARKHYRWSWTLRAPPEKLWPYVSNTERLNKAI